jgi:hypothetical protein
MEKTRNGDIRLNAASHAYPLRKGTLRDTLMKQIILLWKTFKSLPKGTGYTFYNSSNICFV